MSNIKRSLHKTWLTQRLRDVFRAELPRRRMPRPNHFDAPTKDLLLFFRRPGCGQRGLEATFRNC
jgi:hypothetical protein